MKPGKLQLTSIKPKLAAAVRFAASAEDNQNPNLKLPAMFSSSLLGVLHRSKMTLARSLDGQAEPVIGQSLLLKAATFLGLVKGTRLRPKTFRHQDGFCFAAPFPQGLGLPGDLNRLIVYENGTALVHPHSIFDDISVFGRGRYSYRDNQLFFSSSDNSDPTKNGRRYEISLK